MSRSQRPTTQEEIAHFVEQMKIEIEKAECTLEELRAMVQGLRQLAWELTRDAYILASRSVERSDEAHTEPGRPTPESEPSEKTTDAEQDSA